jgi:two-component system cell cycle sensor histidine kinase PleC
LTLSSHLNCRRIAAASIAKSEFLARMSHQLLTPPNSIIGFSEIIANRSLGEKEWEKYTEFAHDINDCGATLLDMINDVLDISNIDSGDLTMEPRRLDLSPIIVEVTRSFKDECNEQGLVIIHERSDKPIEAVADPQAVRKILKNLLSNAIKFSRADGKIYVSSQVVESSVMLVVADSGVGIAEADIPRVVIPFEHIKQAYVSPQLGTGLGLAISKSLAEMQGGSLRVESTEGSGTRVFVTLPTTDAVSVPAP